MNKKAIIIALLAIISITSSVAQEEDSISSNTQQRSDSLLRAHLDIIDQQVIPADTSVRQGVLKNGLDFEGEKRHIGRLWTAACRVSSVWLQCCLDDGSGYVHYLSSICSLFVQYMSSHTLEKYWRSTGEVLDIYMSYPIAT